MPILRAEESSHLLELLARYCLGGREEPWKKTSEPRLKHGVVTPSYRVDLVRSHNILQGPQPCFQDQKLTQMTEDTSVDTSVDAESIPSQMFLRQGPSQ